MILSELMVNLSIKGRTVTWITSDNRDEICKKISEAKLKSNWMKGRVSGHNLGGKITNQYRGHQWNKIKPEAKERDNNQCVSCKMTERVHLELYGQPLQVDHVVPFRDFEK